jgi:hypothetical protein
LLILAPPFSPPTYISIFFFKKSFFFLKKNKGEKKGGGHGGKIDPMWVTGFVDAEGCFSIIIEISEPLK